MLAALEGVGDRTIDPIVHAGDAVMHMRMAMTAAEQAALPVRPACER